MTEPTYSAGLVDAVLQMMSMTDQTSLFEFALQTARQQLHIETVNFVVLDPVKREVKTLAGKTIFETSPDFNTLWDGLEGWVIREKTPTLSVDPMNDVRLSKGALLALSSVSQKPRLALAPAGPNTVMVAAHSGLDGDSLEKLTVIARAVGTALDKLRTTQMAALPAISQLKASDIYWHSVGSFGQAYQQAQLLRWLGSTETGSGTTAIIQGEPGTGKTALAEWLITQAQNRHFRVAHGFVEPHSAPYDTWRRLLIELYPALASIAPTLEGAKDFLATLRSEWGVRAGLLLNIIQLGHVNDPTLAAYTVPQRHDATTNLIIDLVLAAIHTAPLLMVIEDTQWLGEVSRDVLQRFHNRLIHQPQRLMIAMTTTQAPLEGYNQVQTTLLNAEQVAQLRMALVGDHPHLDEMLLKQSGGNPLHVRLILGLLTERNQIEKPGTLSTNIADLVQEAIQGLAPHLQVTLSTAAAIGTQFTTEILSVIHPEHSGESALQGELRQLAPFVRMIDDHTFAFRHPLYWEQAVKNVSPESHQALATHLERRAPSQSHRIAYHYQHSRLPQQARNYLVRAANTAHARGAYHDALAYIDTALNLPGTIGDMEAFAILSEQSDLLFELKQYEQQAEILNRLSEIVQRMNDSWLHAEVGWRWLNHYLQTHQTAEGIATSKLFLEQAEKAYHTVAKAEIIIATALLYQQVAQYAETQNYLDEGASLAGQARNLTLGARILVTLSEVFEKTYRFDLSQACLEQALEVYKSTGNQVGIATCLYRLGTMYYDLGYADMSLANLNLSRQLWQGLGNLREEVLIALQMAETRIQQRRYQEATSLLNESKLMVEQLGETALLSQWWYLYGQVYQGFGDSVQSIQNLQRALEMAQSPEAKIRTYAALIHAQPTERTQWVTALLALDPNLTQAIYPPMVYITTAEALTDAERAKTLIATGQNYINTRAQQIEDEQIRQQYLARPDRRNLLEYNI